MLIDTFLITKRVASQAVLLLLCWSIIDFSIIERSNDRQLANNMGIYS
jgi:hypothetical protein